MADILTAPGLRPTIASPEEAEAMAEWVSAGADAVKAEVAAEHLDAALEKSLLVASHLVALQRWLMVKTRGGM